MVTSAVFTMVKNEKFRLPVWLKYYKKQFDKKDIYILDHESEDGSTENLEYHMDKVIYPAYDPDWRRDFISSFQKKLLDTYDIVLYTDVDEILIPEPDKYRDLREYIEQFTKDCVQCKGYEILHLKSFEPPINLDMPILKQRSFFYRNTDFDKPLLARIPLKWSPGFHKAKNCGEFDEDLYLFHLHRFDFEICKEHTLKWSKRKWSKRAIEKRYAWQNRLVGAEFDRWFSSLDDAKGPLEVIPEKFKNIF